MRINTVLLIISAVLIPHEVNPARILGLFPHPGKSHHMVFEPLLRSLAKRGHHVTTVSFFPLQNPPANYTDVSLQNVSQVLVEMIDLSKFEAISVFSKIPSLDRIVRLMYEFQPLANLGVDICDKLIKWQTLADVLRKEYDVILLEIFNTECMLGLLHVYNNTAPKIGLSSSNLMPWSPDRIGLIDNPAYVPVISIGLSSRMTITERLVNTFLNVFYKLWFYNAVQVKERSLIEKHFGSVIPDMTVLNKNYSLVMVNTFHALNGIRPQLPAYIEVGGMHLDKRRLPLPFYIEKFLNESEHGVILLSFGSLIKTATIPKYKEDIIVNTLSKLKQRVIWKYENSGEEGTLTGNILRVKWLPQYELLQHKKIVAFIAHGGLLGMTEAISAGKPMVVIPFFGDQPANAAAAAAVGFAKVVPYFELSESALSEALASVLSAESRLNARRISSIWRDRQADPLETAVYWTERVIRWGNSAPLHSAARDMPLYQVALLDVIAVFLVAIIILVTLLWYSLSMVFRLLFGKGSKLKMH